MNEPIKAGDRCRIIAGFTHGKSPNLGKTVTVGMDVVPGAFVDRWGRSVQVTGPEVYQMDDSGNFYNAGWALIPITWLEKLPPDEKPPEATTTKKDRELTE